MVSRSGVFGRNNDPRSSLSAFYPRFCMQVPSRKAAFIEYQALHMLTRLARTIYVSRCWRPIVKMSSPIALLFRQGMKRSLGSLRLSFVSGEMCF
jgi:hypothetical protein